MSGQINPDEKEEQGHTATFDLDPTNGDLETTNFDPDAQNLDHDSAGSTAELYENFDPKSKESLSNKGFEADEPSELYENWEKDSKGSKPSKLGESSKGGSNSSGRVLKGSNSRGALITQDQNSASLDSLDDYENIKALKKDEEDYENPPVVMRKKNVRK